MADAAGPRSLFLLGGAVLTLGVGFAIGYAFTGSGHETQSNLTTAAPAALPVDPPPRSAGTPTETPERPRVPIPRPPVRAASKDVPNRPPNVSKDPASEPVGVRDERGLAEPPEEPRPPPQKVPSADMPAALRTVVEEQVKDDIGACLDQWSVATPGLTGRVEMEFQLGPDGLHQVSILDHSEVPMGPLSCFSAAIWDADWPAPAEGGELTVTYPFAFTTAG
jgi:hypothetical protein